MPTPASSLPPELAKLAGEATSDMTKKAGMPMEPGMKKMPGMKKGPSMEGTDDEPSVEEPAPMGPGGVPPEFLAAAKAADKEGLDEGQIGRILSGMLKVGSIKLDTDPKKVAAEFKRTISSTATLLKVLGEVSDAPAPSAGGEVL